MLACQYKAVKVLKYLANDIANNSKDPNKCKQDLLGTRNETQVSINAAHLACYLGDLDILEILDNQFNADFNSITNFGFTCLHCAALNENGIVSIYYLKDKHPNLNPNIKDKFGALPIHYAMGPDEIKEYNV